MAIPIPYEVQDVLNDLSNRIIALENTQRSLSTFTNRELLVRRDPNSDWVQQTNNIIYTAPTVTADELIGGNVGNVYKVYALVEVQIAASRDSGGNDYWDMTLRNFNNDIKTLTVYATRNTEIQNFIITAPVLLNTSSQLSLVCTNVNGGQNFFSRNAIFRIIPLVAIDKFIFAPALTTSVRVDVPTLTDVDSSIQALSDLVLQLEASKNITGFYTTNDAPIVNNPNTEPIFTNVTNSDYLYSNNRLSLNSSVFRSDRGTGSSNSDLNYNVLVVAHAMMSEDNNDGEQGRLILESNRGGSYQEIAQIDTYVRGGSMITIYTMVQVSADDSYNIQARLVSNVPNGNDFFRAGSVNIDAYAVSAYLD